MKRQIEYTFRMPSGEVAQLWVGGATTDESQFENLEQSVLKIGEIVKKLAERVCPVLHTRGPFDVPDGETGGGDGR